MTPDAQARADRIAAALSGLLDETVAVVEAEAPRSGANNPYRPIPAAPGRRSRKPALACPACTGRLSAEYARGAKIQRCLGCNGLWLNPGDLQGMVDPPADDGKAALNVAQMRRTIQSMVPPAETQRYRKCPVCEAVMRRRNFGDRSGVILDECKSHGVYLDAGEFDAIEVFIRLGGLKLQKRSAKERASELQRARRAGLDRPPTSHWWDSIQRHWWWW